MKENFASHTELVEKFNNTVYAHLIMSLQLSQTTLYIYMSEICCKEIISYADEF